MTNLRAVGDLHGDWRKTVDSFRTAGVINVTEDSEIVWTGGDAIVVQLGDVMDRGDHEIGRVLFAGPGPACMPWPRVGAQFCAESAACVQTETCLKRCMQNCRSNRQVPQGSG
eukprot:366097-Chlamydomonas_euryale.AAC.23